MSLERFKQAQADPSSGFETALRELKRGRKQSHWIWYVFPQLTSLGRSETAKFYGIKDLREAQEYLLDSELRERLARAIAVVDQQLARGVELETLLGGRTDSLKLVSSLTLFQSAADSIASEHPELELPEFSHRCEHILMMAGEQGYGVCALTRHALAGN